MVPPFCERSRLPYQHLRICEYLLFNGNGGKVAGVTVSKTRATARPAADHPDDLAPEQVAAAVTAFALLADPTRVRMLWALRETELDVASLAAVAGCRPTAASQHLSKLRFAGLVEGRREGQRVVYRLRGGHVRALLTEALFQADHQVSGAPQHD
jgi:DNA-binding transcriptional ArsR family regulator